MFRKLSFALIGFLLLTTPCFATYSEWSVGHPVTADQAADIGTLVNTNNIATDRLLANYRQGAVISYISTSTLSVSAGEVMCSNIDGSVRKMRQNASATSVGWANIDTGTQSASTTYYVYAVGNAAGGGFTILISLSATTLTGATCYKQLGSFQTDTNTYITNITNNTSLPVYDSGWFSVAANTTYTKSHSLGTTKVLIVAYLAQNSDGSGWCIPLASIAQVGDYQTSIVTLSMTQIQIRTTAHLAAFVDAAGVAHGSDITSGYIRILALSLN